MLLVDTSSVCHRHCQFYRVFVTTVSEVYCIDMLFEIVLLQFQNFSLRLALAGLRVKTAVSDLVSADWNGRSIPRLNGKMLHSCKQQPTQHVC